MGRVAPITGGAEADNSGGTLSRAVLFAGQAMFGSLSMPEYNQLLRAYSISKLEGRRNHRFTVPDGWGRKRKNEARLQLASFLPSAYISAMFDTITAELTTAIDKLDHLRRFL